MGYLFRNFSTATKEALPPVNDRHYFVLDVGFGEGDSLVEMGLQLPEARVLGVEIHKASIAKALRRLDEARLTNVRVVRADMVNIALLHTRLKCSDLLQTLGPKP